MYLVRHCPTEQFRAAKRIKADAQRQRRHELDMMKRLKHPALPQIYDVLEEQGELWLVMEFINGRALSALGQDRIEPELFFSIARQLADVLLYLHTRKPPVLHLDIKPSNIMLRPDGSLALIDFGAAMRAAPENRQGVCFGTPGYAAPEQSVPGMALDIRADHYGYGAMLYYCLYRTVPESAAACRREILADKIRWRRSAAALLARCLEEDRENRFPDTSSLYRGVRKAERRYKMQSGRKKSSAAAVFLLFVLAFAAASLQREPPVGAQAVEGQADGSALLAQADSLGFEQAVQCYGQAIALNPADGAWCAHMLSRIEADYSFSLAEEEALKSLLFSVPPGQMDTEDELLERSASGYGALAYRIGLSYWYFYEGAGGRSAATRWFERAVAAQEADADPRWLESAKIHIRIGSYYELLGKYDMDGTLQADVGVYWNDLVELWGLESLKQESPGVQCEAAKEILSLLIMQTYELRERGVEKQQLQEMLGSLEEFAEKNAGAGAGIEACRAQCEAARAAVERACLAP